MASVTVPNPRTPQTWRDVPSYIWDVMPYFPVLKYYKQYKPAWLVCHMMHLNHSWTITSPRHPHFADR